MSNDIWVGLCVNVGVTVRDWYQETQSLDLGCFILANWGILVKPRPGRHEEIISSQTREGEHILRTKQK